MSAITVDDFYTRLLERMQELQDIFETHVNAGATPPATLVLEYEDLRETKERMGEPHVYLN